MTSHSIAAVVLAAGLGTRMKSDLPKVMHPICGVPMVSHVLSMLDQVQVDRKVVVTGQDMPEVAELAKTTGADVAYQVDRLGTAHAVLAAKDALKDFQGDVLVVFGDTPLITADTIDKAISLRRTVDNPAAVVLGFEMDDPAAFGRLIVDDNGYLNAIVEAKDASPQELAVTLCNSGVMLLDGDVAWQILEAIDCNNAKGEYYLTDFIKHACQSGRVCEVVEGDSEEFYGANNRADLALLESIAQDRLRAHWLAEGVTMTDPHTVYLSADTKLGRDVSIAPFVTFGPGVEVADGVEIKSFCHFEDAKIGKGATVGPYARLRPGAVLHEGAHIGNFVEIKKSVVEAGAKVNHLTYIGDARVGEKANIGAGTITCNYDGFNKSHTDIGKGAFIGSNTSLIAPVKIGDGAIVGAGSAVSEDVEADSLAVVRAPQKQVSGWAERFRTKMRALKAKS
jgi:bifunctional UDP-N-acetylglucosamine pyrophosphorylase/glucosamine-1-phosphate N-acetyltransferase